MLEVRNHLLVPVLYKLVTLHVARLAWLMPLLATSCISHEAIWGDWDATRVGGTLFLWSLPLATDRIRVGERRRGDVPTTMGGRSAL
jgi:hypothetical protein